MAAITTVVVDKMQRKARMALMRAIRQRAGFTFMIEEVLLLQFQFK